MNKLKPTVDEQLQDACIRMTAATTSLVHAIRELAEEHGRALEELRCEVNHLLSKVDDHD